MISDTEHPRFPNDLLTASTTVLLYLLHPLVLVTAVVFGTDYFPLSLILLATFLFVFKGIPMVVLGRRTGYDASAHVATVVWAVLVAGIPGGIVLVALSSFTVWYLQHHNLLGIVGGAVIGIASVLLV